MTSKFISEYLHLMPDVFEGVNSFSKLKKKIEKMEGVPEYNHFAGFLWEYVVAMYFYKFGEHHNVNVCDYRQTYAGAHGEDADYGLDGYGTTMEGETILCQVKYRKNAKIRIGLRTSETLDTFVNEIIRNQEGNKKLIILLCSSTNEYVNTASRSSFSENCFADLITGKLKARGVSIENIEFRVFDENYWKICLNNPRFWDYIRNSVAT